MRIADLKLNDIVDCENGICVSLWMQGCPHKCKGCHNPETWDFNGGYEIDKEECLNQIIQALNAYNIKRHLSILGGEPLCEENVYDVLYILENIKKLYPNCHVYLWTGYTIEQLQQKAWYPKLISLVNTLIDGPYIEELRDIRLKLRGSSNQRIWNF